ncbi:MAG: GNAT family N-acetyltransferase [Pararhodobacter sp.]
MMTDLIPATDADLPAVEAFLAGHAETSMFLRANLQNPGLGNHAPHAMALALTRQAGAITGVFGITQAGYVLCQAPDATAEDWAAFARWLQGRPLAGATGEAAQIAQLTTALGLTSGDLALEDVQPLYRLALEDLRMDGLAPGSLRLAEPDDHALLTRWFRTYEAEALATRPDLAEKRAVERADAAISGDRLRVLIQDGEPVAMTAFNARLADMVQVGGVYTPPDGRGKHRARTAVALHLAEAREEGVSTAILFASGPAACRAYEALGFQRIGAYALAILKEPRHG